MDSNFTRITESIFAMFPSGVASIGARGGRVPPWQQKNCQKLGKRGKIGKQTRKRGKIGKKRQKSGRFFHFPLLTNRAGYATDVSCNIQTRFSSLNHEVNVMVFDGFDKLCRLWFFFIPKRLCNHYVCYDNKFRYW